MVYYLGIMQIVITKIAWLMQISMGTSAAESLNAAGNIFIGQVNLVYILIFFLVFVSTLARFLPLLIMESYEMAPFNCVFFSHWYNRNCSDDLKSNS